MNPLVPSTPDGVVAIAAVGAVILSAAALLSVIITAPRLPGRALLAWALVVALVPFVGPASWFLTRQGKRSAARRHRP
ncbi:MULTISPECIES: PLDc N-terminal domain-containing protein [Curtobacterium]|uniref:PLDc N-terminal domain-containing protein n=1 Tax=Curtobacterium flaccumfaciens TaxID=2035 RepID=UPI003103A414